MVTPTGLQSTEETFLRLASSCIAQRKHSRFPPSSPGFESQLCQDFFSWLLSLWTVLRSNPSSAQQWILQMQFMVTSRPKYNKKSWSLRFNGPQIWLVLGAPDQTSAKFHLSEKLPLLFELLSFHLIGFFREFEFREKKNEKRGKTEEEKSSQISRKRTKSKKIKEFIQIFFLSLTLTRLTWRGK